MVATKHPLARSVSQSLHMFSLMLTRASSSNPGWMLMSWPIWVFIEGTYQPTKLVKHLETSQVSKNINPNIPSAFFLPNPVLTGAWHSNQPRDVHVISDETLSVETGAVEDPKPWIQSMRCQLHKSIATMWSQEPVSNPRGQKQSFYWFLCLKYEDKYHSHCRGRELDDARYLFAICSSSISAPQILPLFSFRNCPRTRFTVETSIKAFRHMCQVQSSLAV